jgi:hypothetical protein
MRFLMTYVANEQTPPTPEKGAAIQKLVEENMKSGILLDTGGLLPMSAGARIKMSKGKFTTTDGPFPETKELVVGYAIVQVRNKEEAIEQARRFMSVAGDGEGEIRQMVGPGDEPHHR